MDFLDYSFKLHKKGGHIVSYMPARQDPSGDPKYDGFLTENGSWLILERNITNGTIKYKTGSSGFATAWAARASQTFVEYDELFS